MKNNAPFGLYIHVPFCASKCRYCDFYSFAGDTAQMEHFVQAIDRQAERFAPMLAGRTADTVYFGGGTPSLLGGERLSKLLQMLSNRFSIAPHAEITVECNPDSMDTDLLHVLRKARVNRLSIGVQSAHDAELRLLGRRHTFAQACTAVRNAQQTGFDNISVDLMYGLPGQSEQMLFQSVDALLALHPQHLSCYSLKLEPGTPMGQEQPVLPDDDAQADWYLSLCERLTQAGYLHYEISNWAKPGFYSRHNSRYWTLSDYLGLGPGAHSYLNGKRFAYRPSLTDFCDCPQPVQEELVAGFAPHAEYIMLRLRTADGIDRLDFESRFGRSFAPYAARLAALRAPGLTLETADGWRLTERGFLVSNSIITDVLSVDEMI
nr:radical SAM family heme chaperone HemW [uncultured Butyricicoccus sp.]